MPPSPSPPPLWTWNLALKEVKIDLIQQAIHEFNWERAFHRKNNEKVSILNNTISNVLSNFTLHEIITCDYTTTMV